MLTDEKTLELAREDYARQETYRETLFQRSQFLITVASLLIAANVTLISSTPPGWRWWLLVLGSSATWVMLLMVFRLIWLMYRGSDYMEPKTIKDYIVWRDDRQQQLEEGGMAEAERISNEEAMRYVVDHFATAAAANREVNLAIQNRMTATTRLTLWMTFATIGEAAFYVIFVTFGS